MTGVIQSLGITWGLFRQYLILVQLLLTVLAIIILLLQMELISYLAGIAAEARQLGVIAQDVAAIAGAVLAVTHFVYTRMLRRSKKTR